MKASCRGVAAASLEGTDIAAGERPAANTRVGVTAPKAPDIGNVSQQTVLLEKSFPLYPSFSVISHQPSQSQPLSNHISLSSNQCIGSQ